MHEVYNAISGPLFDSPVQFFCTSSRNTFMIPRYQQTGTEWSKNGYPGTLIHNSAEY